MQTRSALSISPTCRLFSWLVYDSCEGAINLQFKQDNLENSSIYFKLEGKV